MAEVGFEMMIYSFGSGFSIETSSESYIQRIAADIAYAKSKGIEVFMGTFCPCKIVHLLISVLAMLLNLISFCTHTNTLDLQNISQGQGKSKVFCW